MLSSLILTLILSLFSSDPDPDADFLTFQDDLKVSDGANSPLLWAPQLAVEKVSYMRENGLCATENVILGAVTCGDNSILIFEVVLSRPYSLVIRDLITYNSDNNAYQYFTSDPRFMELQIEGIGPEWCLVVPVCERPIDYPGADPADGGNIMIVRLEERNVRENLVQIDNGLYTAGIGSGYYFDDVYSCREYPDGNGEKYMISIAGVPSGAVQDTVCSVITASFSASSDRFEMVQGEGIITESIDWAHNNSSSLTRPLEHFYFDTTNEHAYLTTHNSGVTIWDYSNQTVLSQIASQQGSWTSGAYFAQLGDIHRATVLDGLGTDGDGKLLFAGNNTMGLLVYDVINAENPLLVFQWDNDSPMENWDTWQGSGTENLSTSYSNSPAYVFGLDVRGNDLSEKIHLYAGNGIDGLRTINFSEFLVPWAEVYPKYAFLELYQHSYNLSVESVDQWAHDLRTFQETDGDILVLTTWREPPSTGNNYSSTDTGEIHVTLHIDDEMGVE